MIIESLTFIFSLVIISMFAIILFILLWNFVSKNSSESNPTFLTYAIGIEIIMWILLTTEFILVTLFRVISNPFTYFCNNILWHILNSLATLAYWFYLYPCIVLLPAAPCIIGLVVFIRERKKPHLKDKMAKKARYLLLVLASSVIRCALFLTVDSLLNLHFMAQIPF